MNISNLIVKFLADDAQFQSVASKMKGTLVGLGGAVAGLFAADKIKDFGVGAIKTAMEAEPSWTRLGQQLQNVKVDFQSVQPEITKLARQIQDVTTVGDETTADILRNLVAITGNYKASLGEVVTVADVAAGANLDYETAAKLVGKVMTGNTSILQRYGIVVKEGENAMDALRERFAGMAANEANTLQGQVTQLNNEWGDFNEAIGNVLISSTEGGSVIALLTDKVKGMAIWVADNEETLAAWVKGGLNVAVGALQLVGRSVSFTGNLIVGFGTAVVAGLVRPFEWVLDGLAATSSGVEKFWRVLGQDEKADAIAKQTAQLRSYADTLKKVGDTNWAVAKMSFADAGSALKSAFTGSYGLSSGPAKPRTAAAPIDLSHVDLGPSTKEAKAAADKLAKEVDAALKKHDFKVRLVLDPASLDKQGFAGTKLARGEALTDAAVAGMRGPVAVAAPQASGPTTRMYVDAAKGLGLQSLSEGLDLVKGSALGLVGGFTPLGLIATGVSAAMEPMQPALDALLMPVRAVGQLLGGVFARALSYVTEGLGWLIYGLAKAVNKLIPFGDPLKGLENFGKEMIDGAKAARSGLTEVGKTADKVSSSLVNVSKSVNVAALRRAVTSGSATVSGGGAAGGVTFTGDIHLHGVQEPEEFLDGLGRVAQQKAARGGTTRLNLSFAGR